MSGKGFLVAMLIASFFAILGAIFFFIGWSELSEGIASSSWLTTEGVIESTDIETETKRDSDGNRKTTYTPRVNYRYQVNGVTFKGDRIGPPIFSTNSRSDAQHVIAPYSTGKKVTVYYAPSDPSRARLETGVNLSSLFVPGIGGCFLLLGIGGLLGFLREFITKRTKPK